MRVRVPWRSVGIGGFLANRVLRSVFDLVPRSVGCGSARLLRSLRRDVTMAVIHVTATVNLTKFPLQWENSVATKTVRIPY